MLKMQIVAKLNPSGLPGALNFLGQDGRNYTLYYRMSILGVTLSWAPVLFADSFPA